MMRLSWIFKSFFFYLSFTAFNFGCMKADTDPSPAFEQVKKEIASLTQESIYWDPSLKDAIVPISTETLLENRLTEDLVIHIALLNNKNLQAIYEELGIAKANLAQSSLLKNPIFSLDYEFSTRSSVTDLINMSILQNILDILLIPLKKRTAQAELEATKLFVTTKILDVIANTKIAFYEFKAAKQTLALQKKILLATELSYEASKKLFNAGNIKKLEMSIKHSTYEQMKLDVASKEIDLLNAREKLNIQMGLWGRQINWEISCDFPELPQQENEFKTVENASIKKSIDLKMSYQKLLATAARFGVDTTKIIFPSVDLGASSEREDSIWYIGPSLRLPLPLFDTGRANAAKARATILKQWNQYTSLAIEIRSKARSFRFSLLNAFRQSQYLKKVIIPLAKKVTHETLLQNNAMQIGVFELLLAKQKELEKKMDYVEKQKQYWLFKIQLQTLLTGHLLEKDYVL